MKQKLISIFCLFLAATAVHAGDDAWVTHSQEDWETNSAKNSNLTFKNKKTNEETTINTNPVIYTNTLELLLNSTIKGIGLCRIPDVFCKDKIKTGELLALLPDHIMVPDRGVYAIYPDRRYLPMKVKLFIDAINSHLRSGAI